IPYKEKKVMERKHLITTISALAALATLASASGAFATNIPIVNPNMDEIYVSQANYQSSLTNPLNAITATLSATNGGSSNGLGTTTFKSSVTYSDGTVSTGGYVPGWSGSGVVAADSSAGQIPAGTYIQGYYFNAHQILTTDVQPNTTYTLTANIGTIYISNGWWQGDNLELSYGASVSGTTFTAGTALAGFNVKGTQTSGSGGYRPAYQSYNQVVFTATTGASVSGPLAISLGNYYSGSGELTAFSGITLSAAPAAVPEAPTLALLGVGAFALLALRRKRV
ncbi:MAG: PEP-CTERM sorting domain-containing protein, partial [Phycisphaerae bacterium]